MRLFRTLSGRFLILTVIFVMIAEVLIFVPSVARFRLSYLQEKLELAQIASLALLATPDDMVDPELEGELLANAEVLNIVLRRDEVRELILASPMPAPVDETFDLRNASIPTLIWDAMRTVAGPSERVIRVIGMPVKSGGVEIEATLQEAPLRDAMMEYGENIFWLSLFISALTASLLFFAVRWLIVRPMNRVITHMTAYRDSPEDVHRIIKPQARVTELLEAEMALADMQSQITQSLKQKDRLAALGGSVARISHDLRNMLTTAQLLADRMETSTDPAIAKSAPKVINSLTRAINLCESTLAFGKAEEPAPAFRTFNLGELVAEVFESDELRATHGGCIDHIAEIPEGLTVSADPEQLYRVLTNLVRNARQAIESTGEHGVITVSAAEIDGGCQITLRDTGPGLPKKAIEHLFQPFQGGARRGGTGLGLAIAAELVKGHGGKLELVDTSPEGTVFRIYLPGETS